MDLRNRFFRQLLHPASRVIAKSNQDWEGSPCPWAHFADELDWPIGTGDLEEATFQYSPGELGVPADQVPQLRSLNQLRPLTTNQPWGIFFLEFDGPRLPLTPLRRLLVRLTLDT